MSDTMDDEGLSLLASLVGANVDHLAHLNDALLQCERREAKKFAEGLVDLYDALDAVPDYARSVTVERALSRATYRYDVARAYIANFDGDPTGDAGAHDASR